MREIVISHSVIQDSLLFHYEKATVTAIFDSL